MLTDHQYKVPESLLSSPSVTDNEQASFNRLCVSTSDKFSRKKDQNYCIGCGACRGNANDDTSPKASILGHVIAALVIILLAIIINRLL
ncbi:MAG: hypothetical protein GX939_00790 [Clostridiaceae bacterium]|jgi:NAD-dependent dihydropyrimidine dehydrogenase PreA subunit|nr:hypothetical protein [Clostridiaceae bacterium]